MFLERPGWPRPIYLSYKTAGVAAEVARVIAEKCHHQVKDEISLRPKTVTSLHRLGMTKCDEGRRGVI